MGHDSGGKEPNGGCNCDLSLRTFLVGKSHYVSAEI